MGILWILISVAATIYWLYRCVGMIRERRLGFVLFFFALALISCPQEVVVWFGNL